MRQGLEQADFARKRELLELLIDRIVVTDETVEIRYVIPVGPEGERDPFCLLRTDYQRRLIAAALWACDVAWRKIPSEEFLPFDLAFFQGLVHDAWCRGMILFCDSVAFPGGVMRPTTPDPEIE